MVDFLRSFDRVVDYALNTSVDLVVFAGDAYKTRHPNPTYQREFARRIHRLVTNGLPVFLLVGNHGMPNTWGRATTMEIFTTLEVDRVHVARVPGTHRIETRGGPVQVVALPWILRSQLLTRDEFKNKTLEEIDAVILEKTENIIAHEIDTLDPEVPAILVAHGTVFGATYGSERSVLLGQDIILPRSVIAHPAFRYVALGHIHKHQEVHDSPPAVYSGSIERIDFGEEKEDKGFVVAEIGEGATHWQFVRLPARPFVTVRVEAAGDDPTGEVLAAIEGQEVDDAVVRVLIRTTAEKEPLIRDDEIHQALSGSFYVAAISKEVERTTRLRLGDQSVEELTSRQVLERYLQARQTPPERIETLLEYADEIFEIEIRD